MMTVENQVPINLLLFDFVFIYVVYLCSNLFGGASYLKRDSSIYNNCPMI